MKGTAASKVPERLKADPLPPGERSSGAWRLEVPAVLLVIGILALAAVPAALALWLFN
jgi:hypothetical protein